MDTVSIHLDDVKYLLPYLDPYAGNYAVLLETDQHFIDVAVIAGKIDPFSFLYRQGEIDVPDTYVHEAGFVARFLEDGTVRVPHKDLPRWPFPSSKPADFQTIILDRLNFVPIHGIPPTDTLIVLQRPVQPGEISKREISHVNTVMRVRERRAQEPDQQDQTERPARLPRDIPEPHRKRAKIIPLDKKRPGVLPRPPIDLLIYHLHSTLRRSERATFTAMYRASVYTHSRKLYQWHEPIHRLGRFYFNGNDHLAYMAGFAERTIEKALARLKQDKFIRLRHRGYPGEGNSIWELPYNLSHVFSWRRNPKL